MKKLLLLIILSVACYSLKAVNVVLGGVEHTMDTIEHYQVGPGTWYTTVHFAQVKDGSWPLDVFILQVDLKNPYITVESILANDELYTPSKSSQSECPSSMAKRHTSAGHHVIAGTNADFFTTQGTNLVEGTSSLIHGRPSGGVIINHQVASIQPNNRQSFAIDDNKRVYIGKFTRKMNALVNGEKLTINNVNYTRAAGKLTLFNELNGPITTAVTAGTEVLCSLKEGQVWGENKDVTAIVEAIEQNNGGMSIPKGKFVLSGNGSMATKLDALQVGDEVTIHLDLTMEGNQKADWAYAVGGPDATKYAQMVRNGATVQDSVWASREPRTGIGYSQNRDTVIWCVVDGRHESKGCTTLVEGDIMRLFGAYDAMNLDGGGSSAMYLEAYGKPMNNVSDGSERACGDGVFAVCTSPDDNEVARIEAYSPIIKAPLNGSTKFKFLAYNKYDYLLNTDLEGVTLSCDAKVGQVLEDGSLMALGDGEVTASYGDVTSTIKIQIDNNVKVGFVLDSILISDDTDYIVQIQGTVGTNLFSLSPSVLNFSFSDPTIATITSDGVLNGLQNGRTLLYANLGTFSDTTIVNVEIPASRPILWNKMLPSTDWSIKPSASSWNTEYTTSANGNALVNLTYKTARNPNIKFYFGTDETEDVEYKLYSLPTTIELRYTNTLPLSEISFGLRANNSATPTGVAIAATSTGENHLLLDVDSAFTFSDIAIFPLSLRYVTFSISSDAKKDENYSVEIEGIYLHYGELILSLPQVINHSGSTDGKMHIYDIQGREYPSLNAAPSGLLIIQTSNETIKTIKK